VLAAAQVADTLIVIVVVTVRTASNSLVYATSRVLQAAMYSTHCSDTPPVDARSPTHSFPSLSIQLIASNRLPTDRLSADVIVFGVPPGHRR